MIGLVFFFERLAVADAALGHEHERRGSCQQHCADDVCVAASRAYIFAICEVPFAVVSSLYRPFRAHRVGEEVDAVAFVDLDCRGVVRRFDYAGCLPGWCVERKVAQVGAGKIFGSEAFVMRWIYGLGDKFSAARTAAHAVGEIGFSSHGWRLAKMAERAA